MVQSYWEATERLFISTSTMYRFSKKLKNLKPLIREMGRDKLGNLSKKAKEAYGMLCEKQSITLGVLLKFLFVRRQRPMVNGFTLPHWKKIS